VEGFNPHNWISLTRLTDGTRSLEGHGKKKTQKLCAGVKKGELGRKANHCEPHAPVQIIRDQRLRPLERKKKQLDEIIGWRCKKKGIREMEEGKGSGAHKKRHLTTALAYFAQKKGHKKKSGPRPL